MRAGVHGEGQGLARGLGRGVHLGGEERGAALACGHADHGVAAGPAIGARLGVVAVGLLAVVDAPEEDQVARADAADIDAEGAGRQQTEPEQGGDGRGDGEGQAEARAGQGEGQAAGLREARGGRRAGRAAHGRRSSRAWSASLRIWATRASMPANFCSPRRRWVNSMRMDWP